MYNRNKQQSIGAEEGLWRAWERNILNSTPFLIEPDVWLYLKP